MGDDVKGVGDEVRGMGTRDEVRGMGTGDEARGVGREERERRYEDFYDLEVWKRAKEIVGMVYKLTKDFPRQEAYSLTDQVRRSTSSICANIAEGFSRYHSKEKIKFYYNARGSISESMNHVLIAQTIGYLPADISNELLDRLRLIRKMLNAMINSVANSPYYKKK
ncbi:MAG: four helix bundle protein [Candidatus Margulisiibacteriota bacterium]